MGQKKPLFEDKVKEVEYEDKKVVIQVRSATLKDFKSIQSEFLRLIQCLQNKQDFNLIEGIDKIVAALSIVKIGEEVVPTEDLPFDLLAQVVEAIVDANFTVSKLSVWQTIAGKIEKTTQAVQSPKTIS